MSRRRLLVALLVLSVVALPGCVSPPETPEGPAMDVVWYRAELTDAGGVELEASVVNHGSETGSVVVVANVSSGGGVVERSREVAIEPATSEELTFSFGPEAFASPPEPGFDYGVRLER